MINEIVEKIKKTEGLAQNKIEEAGSNNKKRIKDFKETCDTEWIKINTDLEKEREEILKRFEKEASEEIGKIREENIRSVAGVQKLASKKEELIKSIIKKISEEK